MAKPKKPDAPERVDAIHDYDGASYDYANSFEFLKCVEMDQFNKAVGAALTRFLARQGSREAAIDMLEVQISALRSGVPVPPSHVNLLARRVDVLAARRYGKDTAEHSAFRDRLLEEMKAAGALPQSANRESLRKRLSDAKHRNGGEPQAALTPANGRNDGAALSIGDIRRLELRATRFLALEPSGAMPDDGPSLDQLLESDTASDASDVTSDASDVKSDS